MSSCSVFWSIFFSLFFCHMEFKSFFFSRKLIFIMSYYQLTCHLSNIIDCHVIHLRQGIVLAFIMYEQKRYIFKICTHVRCIKKRSILFATQTLSAVSSFCVNHTEKSSRIEMIYSPNFLITIFHMLSLILFPLLRPLKIVACL